MVYFLSFTVRKSTQVQAGAQDKFKNPSLLWNIIKTGSADRSDMQVSYVKSARKSIKWYKKTLLPSLEYICTKFVHPV